jgi:GAF domain-containing protein/two-component sensor histidine kinase
MTEIGALNNEVDILYAISGQLARATTPEELLEAASSYARQQGATNARLIYIDGDGSEQPYTGLLVAEWSANGFPKVGIGHKYEGFGQPIDPASQDWMANPDQPLLVGDVLQYARFHADIQQRMERDKEYSIAILPLNNRGRWVGVMTFSWHHRRYQFDERDRRIYIALIRQTAPAIDSLRLLRQNQARANRAEHLLKINTALSQARDEIEILQSLALYTRTQQAAGMILYYVDTEGEGDRIPRPVALWEDNKFQLFDPSIHKFKPIESMPYPNPWLQHPNEVLMIEDYKTDPRVSEGARKFMDAKGTSRAVVTIPFFMGGRYHGRLAIFWKQPRHFSDEERYIYTSLLRTLPSLVASRRAYLAEQSARQERELLYHAGASINAATTFAEIVDSLAGLKLGDQGIVLTVFENFNYEGARYINILAVSARSMSTPGESYSIDSLPVVRLMQPHGVTYFEDVTTDPRVDETSRATFARYHVRAILNVGLSIDKRWIGRLAFHDDQPRVYTPLELRLAAGLGELVTAAVERIRLRMETDASRKRAEHLAQINAALSQASSEEAILEAVAPYVQAQGARGMILTYMDVDDQNQVVQSRQMAVWRDGVTNPPASDHRLVFMGKFGYHKLWYEHPDSVLLIENLANETRLPEATREAMLAEMQSRAIATLPLFSSGRVLGLFSIFWFEPHTFSDEERQIYTALLRTLPAVVASRRAYSAEQEARQERELLYRASAAMNTAETFSDIVDSLAAIQLSSSGIALTVFENFDYDNATFVEIIARKGNTTTTISLPSANFPASERFSRNGVTTFVAAADSTTEVPLPDTILHYGIQTSLNVGLSIGSRWIGGLSFQDVTPRSYTEQEKRLALGIGELVSATLERIRLSRETVASRKRAEHLAQINAALSQAKNEEEILEAVAPYVESQGAYFMSLVFMDVSANGAITWTARALWQEKTAKQVNLASIETASTHPYGFDDLWFQTPDQVLLIENLADDPRLTEQARNELLNSIKSRAIATLPLYSGGRYQGVFSIAWLEAHKFSEEEKIVYNSLLQTLSSVVASRRAYLAEEEARQESEFLYLLSESINAATSYQEMTQAISRIDMNVAVFALALWENLDFDQARHLEFRAVVNRSEGVAVEAGLRVPSADLPMMQGMSHHDLWVSSDTLADPKVDPVSAEFCRTYGIRAAISVPLTINGRWAGTFSFINNRPRQFSDREQRLTAGIGDLVAAAIERIQLQSETEASRRRAEQLAQVNAALSQASDEWDILAAVGGHVRPLGCQMISMYYVDTDAEGRPESSVLVAAWQDDQPLRTHPQLGAILPQTAFPAASIWNAATDRITIIEDDSGRRGYATLLIIPLYSSGRWQGIITCEWTQPHSITTEERNRCEALIQTVGAVVAGRRAYIAEEEARHENEVLYRASRAINAAASYAEVIHAVGLLQLNNLSVVLGIWQDSSYDGASFLELVADRDTDDGTSRLRLPITRIPLMTTMSHEHLLVVEDTSDPTQIDPLTAAVAAELKVGSFAAIPLTIGQRFIGVLIFYSAATRPYISREKRLISGIGDLVLAAMERIRLQAETERARQQAETLATLNAALSQATDEQSILDAVAQLAEQYGAWLSTLYYSDGSDQIDIVALRYSGENTPQDSRMMLLDSFPLDDYPVLRLIYQNPDAPVFLEDTLNDPRTETGMTRDFLRKADWKAAILMPLKSAEQWQGMLSFAWTEAKVFPTEMRTLFDAIRPTVSSVVTSRRAYLAEEAARRETELRAHQLKTVAKVSAAAASILDIGHLLDTVSELTHLNFQQYHMLIYLLDESGQQLVYTPARQDETLASSRHAVPLNAERSLIATVGRTRRSIIVNNTRTAADFDFMPSAAILDMHSEMALPLVVADRLIGVLDVQSNQPNRFSESDVWVMTALADLISVAIQNARLYGQAQVLAALEERTRLARELHDSVSQALYGIGLGARTARALLDRDPSRLREPLDYVMSLAEAGLTEMRALIFELRPESLEQEGLITALSKQASSLQARHNIRVNTDFGEEPQIAVEVKESVYRIAREALHNTVKHAQATQVFLSLKQDEEGYKLRIEDNGSGFDAGHPFPGHLGLQSMRERTARLKGHLHIDSAPGQGTRIVVHIPFDSCL